MSTRTIALERIASGTAGASENEVKMARALLQRATTPPTHSGSGSGSQHRRYGTTRDEMLAGVPDGRMSTLLSAEAAAGFDWHSPERRGWSYVSDGYGFAATRDSAGAYHCDQCGCAYEAQHVDALRCLPGWRTSPQQWFVQRGGVICPGCVFGAIQPTQVRRFIAGPTGLAITV